MRVMLLASNLKEERPLRWNSSNWPGADTSSRARKRRGRRAGTAAEAAAAVLWLASPEAGFTVGHDLVIDGGATA
jgi:NAD(P)-dependent dehydrogenase (short-subunit alcohol dehydrogenase family)